MISHDPVEFTELKRHLWAWGYFVASPSNVTDEVIKQYIESQEKTFPPDDGTKLTTSN